MSAMGRVSRYKKPKKLANFAPNAEKLRLEKVKDFDGPKESSRLPNSLKKMLRLSRLADEANTIAIEKRRNGNQLVMSPHPSQTAMTEKKGSVPLSSTRIPNPKKGVGKLPSIREGEDMTSFNKRLRGYSAQKLAELSQKKKVSSKYSFFPAFSLSSDRLRSDSTLPDIRM